MRKTICHTFFTALLLAGGAMISSCSKDPANGDKGYLAGDMIVTEVNGVTMFFLDNHDGTVSATYDQRNPMHKTDDNTYALTDYIGEVTIPASINFQGKNYSVTGVTEAAFMNNTQLTKLTLPPTITSMGQMAFYGCSGLQAVYLSDATTRIPEYCFMNCRALNTVKLPQNLNVIGKQSFRSCTSITTLVLPDKVKELEDSAFYNCTSLAIVELSNSLTTLGAGAFATCRALVEVTIPESVKEIKPLCFCSFDSNGKANWARLTLNVKSTVPPTLTGTIANQTTRRRIVVPRGYRDVYMQTPYWDEFEQVMERNY